MNKLSFFIGLRHVVAKGSSRSVSFMSGVAITGLVIAVTLLILVLSVMNGFKQELQDKILAIVPELSIYHVNGIKDWQQLKDMQHSSIVGIAPFIDLKGMLTKSGKVQPLLVRAVDFELEKQVSIIDRYITSAAQQTLSTTSNTIILGKTVADKLKAKVNDKLTLVLPSEIDPKQAPAILRLTLIDTIDTKTELDKGFGLVSLKTAYKLQDDLSVTGVRVKLDNLFNAADVSSYLNQLLPQGFYTDDWQRTHGNLYSAIEMSKKMVGLLLVLIIAIAAFNVISTLIMVVVDKQSAIAILRTLGAGPGTIMGIFMVQGALVGLIGTTIGLLLGLLLAFFVGDIVSGIENVFDMQLLDATIYPVSFIPSSIELNDVVNIVVASVLMSFLATIYPAYKASKVQPAEVLRYE